MNAPARTIRWSFLLLALSFLPAGLAGCGPKIKVGYRDASLTRASLAARGLGIGGMTTIVAPESSRPLATAVLDSLLWARLRTDLVGVPLKPLDYARRALGEEGYGRFLSLYEQSRPLSAEGREMLAGAFPDSGAYLLLGCVDENRVWFEQTAATGSTVNMTHRQIGVAWEVYDCRLGRSVWKSRLTLHRTTGASAPEEKTFSLGSIASSILFPDDRPEFEEAPDATKMLWTLFGGLPKALIEE